MVVSQRYYYFIHKDKKEHIFLQQILFLHV